MIMIRIFIIVPKLSFKTFCVYLFLSLSFILDGWILLIQLFHTFISNVIGTCIL